MNRTIWLYWEGPQPPYIALCYRTVLKHNEQVRMLDRSGFEELFKSDRDIDIDRLALNHKSDFIRAYLLKHYGGLYVDADCLVLRSLRPVLELAEERGFVGYREPQGYMSCNFMASVAGGAVISEHYARVCQTLRSQSALEWLDLASTPMEQTIAAHPSESLILPTDCVMPVNWSESEQFCVMRADEEHEQFLRGEAYCYMLSNHTIKSRLQTRILCYMPEADLLGSRYFISFLFRKSLLNGGQ
jgi:hypothetical protein